VSQEPIGGNNGHNVPPRPPQPQQILVVTLMAFPNGMMAINAPGFSPDHLKAILATAIGIVERQANRIVVPGFMPPKDVPGLG
jgi:hypothetical protein